MKQLLQVCALSLSFLISVDLSSQELTIYQGFWGEQFYEDDVRIERKSFVDKINSNPVSMEHWRKYKKNIIGSTIFSVGTGVGVALWINVDQGESKTFPIALTAGSAVLSSIFGQFAMKNKKEALLSYNKSKDVGLRVSPATQGIGLALHF